MSEWAGFFTRMRAAFNGFDPVLGPCQVADLSVRNSLPCPVRDSAGFRCEVIGLHERHRVSEHTVRHALLGADSPCSAVSKTWVGDQTPIEFEHSNMTESDRYAF